jgi:8-oxo-dGTP pyrophosphatase MutT (NUDIX family)
MSQAPTRAAVLVPLVFIDGKAQVVYIERAGDAPTHPGDTAFPGGRHHPERDESLWATALREAEEEIGLRPNDVELLHALPEVRTLTSNFLIAPFVGRIVRPYVFRADPREVTAVITVPIADLRARPNCRAVRRRLSSGGEVEVPAFVVGDRVIWGATYRITEELLRALS